MNPQNWPFLLKLFIAVVVLVALPVWIVPAIVAGLVFIVYDGLFGD